MNGNVHESTITNLKVTSGTDQTYAAVKRTNDDVGRETESSEDVVHNALYKIPLSDNNHTLSHVDPTRQCAC